MNECLLRVVATACGGRIQLHNRWLYFLARSEYYFDAEVRISKGLFNDIRGNLGPVPTDDLTTQFRHAEL